MERATQQTREVRRSTAGDGMAPKSARVQAGGARRKKTPDFQRRIIWPATAAELKTARYKQASAKTCDKCSERFHWFTTPNGKYIPLSMLANDTFMPHFAVCRRNADSFRGETETICRAELEAYAQAPSPARQRQPSSPSAQRALFDSVAPEAMP